MILKIILSGIQNNCIQIIEQIMAVFIKRQLELQPGLFVDKGSGSGIFPDPDPGDPKRPDPTRNTGRFHTI